jgi:hypothetical protein
VAREHIERRQLWSLSTEQRIVKIAPRARRFYAFQYEQRAGPCPLSVHPITWALCYLRTALPT